MVRVFVYEFATGGGFLEEAWGSAPASLLREGMAMAGALAADFAAGGAEVVTLRDYRLNVPSPPAPLPARERGDLATPEPLSERERGDLAGWPFSGAGSCGVQHRVVRSSQEERAALAEFAAARDWTIVIAPEGSGALLDRCRQVEAAGGRLVGPGPTVVALASDKHATVEHLAAFGLPVPQGFPIEPHQAVPARAVFPAVGKPRWGAGSQGVRLLPDRQAAEAWLAGLVGPGRLERHCPGMAASVAVLCGPAGVFPLVPCAQRLSCDGQFTYHGGWLPLEPALADRATALAVRAVAALPEPTGYLGVDLVLGADPDGHDDAVIEINPRLTTSYVGLRAAAAPGANLAAALLAVREGRQPRLSFLPVRVQFEPDGKCELSAISYQLSAFSHQLPAAGTIGERNLTAES